ncbi:MAG: hypothetical protein H7X94_05525, partial [Vallitaleaceae bacterium]|nr:hypothetical protein [Vallitaleaceae bacterium]
MKLWNQIFHPEVFQGNTNDKHYFEGWYFKHLSVDGKIIVFIPGVSY